MEATPSGIRIALSLPMRLRPFQNQALKILFKKHPSHVVVIAPTGTGKSLIFERVSSWHHQRILIISPLLALSRQHSSNLKANDRKVLECFGSRSEFPKPGEDEFVWIVSPEKLFRTPNSRLLEAALEAEPDLIVIDECHLMMEWGKSFRPSLYEIPTLVEQIPSASTLWLTASLPPREREEFFSRIPKAHTLIDEFGVPENLTLLIKRVPWSRRVSVLTKILEDLLKHGDGIIFVPTRSWAQKLTEILKNFNRAPDFCAAYHAGLSKEERLNIERLFKLKKLRMIVATSAFGLGMDVSHLFWVVLWQTPLSLTSLAQSLGRVARNGAEGVGLLLWDTEDFSNLRWAITDSPEKQQDLMDVIGYIEDEGCRKAALRRYFNGSQGELVTKACGLCDLCLSKCQTLLH